MLKKNMNMHRPMMIHAFLFMNVLREFIQEKGPINYFVNHEIQLNIRKYYNTVLSYSSIGKCPKFVIT